MKKIFEHKNPEYCELCLKPIDTVNDKWCVRIVYEGTWEEFRFFHAKCFDDFLKGKMDMMKDRIKDKMQGVMGMLKPMLQGLTG